MSTSDAILDTPPPPGEKRLWYGSDSQSFGDLRLPPEGGPHPVAVVLHGGYWRAKYDLAYMGHLCAALARCGTATWNVEYRRLGQPGGGWPGTFQDVAQAADHLRQLALKHPLDLSRVVTLGHSAGGQLAFWLAGRRSMETGSALATPDPLPVGGAIALAGVLDLRLAHDLGLSDGAVESLLGGGPEDVPDRYAGASPAALLPLGVPQALIHGSDDEDVPPAMSQSYARAAILAGDPVTYLPLPGAGHFEPVDPGSREWPTVLRAVQYVVALSVNGS